MSPVALRQEHFVRESSSHIPAICHEEVISGLAARTATTYPQQIGIACTGQGKQFALFANCNLGQTSGPI